MDFSEKELKILQDLVFEKMTKLSGIIDPQMRDALQDYQAELLELYKKL